MPPGTLWRVGLSLLGPVPRACDTHAMTVAPDPDAPTCDGVDACDDLNCDGYPDLVLTGKALSIVDSGFLVRALGSLEGPYWELYRGTEKGFSDTPEAWMIPPGGTKTGGFARGESTPEKIGDDCWRLRDLDGNLAREEVAS